MHVAHWEIDGFNQYDPFEDTERFMFYDATLTIGGSFNQYDPFEDTESRGAPLFCYLRDVFQPIRSVRGY